KNRELKRQIIASLTRDQRASFFQTNYSKKFNASLTFKPNVTSTDMEIKHTSSEVTQKFPVEPFEPRIKPKHGYKRVRTRSINLKLNNTMAQDMNAVNDSKAGNSSTIEAESKNS